MATLEELIQEAQWLVRNNFDEPGIGRLYTLCEQVAALTPSRCSCSTRAAEALKEADKIKSDGRWHSCSSAEAVLDKALRDIRDNPCAALTVEAVEAWLRENTLTADRIAEKFRARFAKEAPDA